MLALSAAGHEGATSHVVGQLKRGRRPGVGHYRHGPVPGELALQLLGQLVDVYDRGMLEPLPLGVQTGCAFAEAYCATGQEQRALDDADRTWTTTTGRFTVPGEQDDPAFARAFGPGSALGEVAGTPGPDESWKPGVTTRLGQLALRVWEPLVVTDVEQREWV